MKKLIVFVFVAIVMAFQGCEGPVGPQGPEGPPGEDGGIFVGSAFEIEVDFNEGNNYELIEEYGFDVFPYDVTLVYIKWSPAGEDPIWRLIPQNIYFEEGVLQYNFDFTDLDVRIFLDGTIDFAILGDEWTQNQVFRVIVVPADNVDARMDFQNYEAVTKMLGLTDEDFVRRN
ncbi:hypothetical protein QWY93_04990 [Echinicola jeungdonensis]|uniref:Collagen-like protein n=1 Tax=Echinicola jeungdonensis TaxID=709343 RepID=A0ABV5J5A2_9BACT|nr:hypothetical protein [Echinicola jeungdonensis]MDN3668680.1 hypothetical protein [Echinicola jeungdonensis]